MEIFAPILGMGVGVDVQVGSSLKRMLCEQLNLPPAYLQERIQTILVNGHAVDQVDQVILGDGDVIALSAAMPGLVGATLRKGGVLSPMRAAISQRASENRPAETRNGRVLLKLFNMVTREMGPRILAHGVWLTGKTWASIASELSKFRGWRGDVSPEVGEVFIVVETTDDADNAMA